MHPDSIVAGLRRELERAPERAKEIEAELEHWLKQDRPVTLPEDLVAVADHDQVYLDALKKEFGRIPVGDEDRAVEVKTEIARVQGLIDEKRLGAPEPAPEVEVEPHAEPLTESSAEPAPVESPVAVEPVTEPETAPDTPAAEVVAEVPAPEVEEPSA